MNVNEKGYLGLVEVIRDLTKKGYEVFTPLHDYSAVDIIVMNSGFVPKRIQVKYRAAYENVVSIPFCSVVNGKKVKIDHTAIDGWAIYCPDVDKVMYVGISQVDTAKGSFDFRLVEGRETVNEGKQKRLLYTSFLDEKVIW